MITTTRPKPFAQRIVCSIYRKEILRHTVLTPDGEGYIGRFCPIACPAEFEGAQRSSGTYPKPT